MSFIPLFKNMSLREFSDRFDVKIRHRQPVMIYIPSSDLAHIDPALMTNGVADRKNDTVRFAVTQCRADHYDWPDKRTTLSAWVYLDEKNNQLIAINSSVQNIYQRNKQYNFEDTPFQEIVLFGGTD